MLSKVLSNSIRENWSLLLLLSLCLFTVVKIGGILAPFITAFIVAFGFSGLSKYFQVRFKLSQLSSGSVCLGLLLLVFTLLALLIIPLIIQELTLIYENLPAILNKVKKDLLPWINAKLGLSLNLDTDLIQAYLQKSFLENKKQIIPALLGGLQSGSTGIFGFFGFAALFWISLFFFLTQWREIIRGFWGLVPPRKHHSLKSLSVDIHKAFGDYLKGQVVVMLGLAFYYSLALSFAGLHSSVAIGVTTGLLACIPFLGYAIGVSIALLAAALEFQSIGPILVILGIYLAGQALESFVLTPFIVGDRIGVHPLSLIIVLALFGSLFGLIGMAVALPACAAMSVIYARLVAGYKKSNYFNAKES